MKSIIKVFLLLILSAAAYADEVALFDGYGDAVAYVVTDDDFTIYLWEGEPVAYLVDDSVYGFNGEHLAWYKDGVFYDHDGFAMGFVEGAVNIQTNLKPLKGLKSLKSLKSLKELKPLKPSFRSQWSKYPLGLVLKTGGS